MVAKIPAKLRTTHAPVGATASAAVTVEMVATTDVQAVEVAFAAVGISLTSSA